MDGSAPWRQTSFDWRAAGNFTFGASGAGLAFFAALLAFESGGRVIAGFLLAPLLVAAGIALVWVEIGRPKQFLHVFFHPQTPWKTREAIIAPVLVVATLVALVFPISIILLLVLAASGGFLYAQGRILTDAEGPSAWRYRGVVPLILSTGAAEGAALLAVVATLTFSDDALAAVRLAFLLAVLRWPMWTFYRNGLAQGAPAQAAGDAAQLRRDHRRRGAVGADRAARPGNGAVGLCRRGRGDRRAGRGGRGMVAEIPHHQRGIAQPDLCGAGPAGTVGAGRTGTTAQGRRNVCMTSAETAAGVTIRPLRGDDLDAVVAIDRSVVGRPRIPFYQRRLAHLDREPDAFVALAAERDGALAGFLLARLYEGEFGGEAPEAALDAVGVATAWRGQGIARTLLARMVEAMRARGVRAIATEAEWSDTGLIGFFARAGFSLSPHIVLQRRVDGATP